MVVQPTPYLLLLCMRDHSFSDGNQTAASYQLCFSVPPETEDFMRYRMSKEFVMNVLRQNIYDQEGMYGLDVPGCLNMRLDPASLLRTRKCHMGKRTELP